MARSIGGKSLRDDSLVIVCEGTETEYPYFLELCKEHPNYRVVPTASEKVTATAKAKRSAVKRKLKKGDSSVFSGKEYYVGLSEVDDETYKRYKAEPTRWVRAAQLFQQRDGYYDAWAVYDLDKCRETAHAVAYKMQNDRLHIAFSAYCFEEWILLHFERNTNAFTESECKKDENKVKCGDVECHSQFNCNGNICLGGRLRAQNFIPKYDKKNGKEYAQITLDRFHIACVNAAWSRSLSPDPFYMCNPYSNVDKLVMRLLDKQYDIQWLKPGDVFNVKNNSYKLEYTNNYVKLIRIGGTSVSIIGHDNIFWCDNLYEPLSYACEQAKIFFDDDTAEVQLSNKPNNNAILCIKEFGTVTLEYYFEII